jgi:hypothetical protein
MVDLQIQCDFRLRLRKGDKDVKKEINKTSRPNLDFSEKYVIGKI